MGDALVIPKALGFPTFLDMPASKATVPHPKFHLIPVYGGAYKKTAVTDDFAKDVIAKVDAVMHPPKPLKSAKFGKIAKIMPDAKGLNLNVKVVEDAVEKELPKGGKAYEVKGGDASACVTMSLAEGQKGELKKGKCYELRNAHVKMVKGHIMLVIDKWGKIEESSEEVTPSTEKDISATEYEL